MWDPGNYLDTDYGLEDGESFEPDGAEEWDDVDLSQPHIHTVLGPIPVDALGVCLPFEYLSANDPVVMESSGAHLPLRDRQIAEELEAFFVSGGRSIVNVVPVTGDKALRRLRALGRRLPVQIITAVAPSSLVASTADRNDEPVDTSLAGVVVIDLSLGLPTAEQAQAVALSGLPVLIRGGNADLAPTAISTLATHDVIPSHTTVMEGVASGDSNMLATLAAQGVMIGFEGVGTGTGADDARIAASVVRLMEAGYGEQILVSTGLQSPTQFVSQGGTPGWPHMLEHFSLQLMAAGVPALGIRQILIDNPAVALTVMPVPTQPASEAV